MGSNLAPAPALQPAGPRRFRRPGRRLAAAAIAVLALGGLLAACGSSSDDGSKTTTTEAAGPTDSSTSAPAADLTVTVKDDGELGTILADPAGKTLYTLTKDGAAVDCTGPCLGAWPALPLASGATTPAGPDGVTGLTVVDGPDGAKLVAADGLPLYTFAGDASAADAKGEGLASFGGTWHVVKTTAAVAPAAAGGDATTVPEETTTTASPSGY